MKNDSRIQRNNPKLWSHNLEAVTETDRTNINNVFNIVT